MSETVRPVAGTLGIPERGGGPEASSEAEVDRAVADVRGTVSPWLASDVEDRIALLDEVRASTAAAATGWAEAAATAKGIDHGSAKMGEAWLNGPVVVLRNLRLLAQTLGEIRDTGRPRPPSITTRPDGQVSVKVAPAGVLDHAMLPFFSGEVRIDPALDLDEVEARIGGVYRRPDRSGGVMAVLGAGNVSSIAPMDVLHALFARDHTVVLKVNPVLDHLSEHLARAFAPLIDRGLLRIVHGGATVGDHLTRHPGVDTIHMTGSDKTYDAIVFGTGDEGARRRAADEPRLDKPVTAELGNVSPVIVVPGPWSEDDLAFHGENIASMLVQNAGFNCVAARVLVTHRSWAKRAALLDAVRDSLSRAEPRLPYYPGAEDRWSAFVEAHPEAERYGSGPVPFTLIPGVDPDGEDELAFRTEAFCGVFAETALDAPRSVPAFIDQAVDFCNDRVWGTLSASILVHPRSLEDPETAAALERAIDRLRYGSVVVNHWSAVTYGMVTTPWGAYPGSTRSDIRSGTGVVHDTYLLPEVEKAVVRGPFRTMTKPLWFHTNRTARQQAELLARLEAGDRTVLPKLTWHALRG